MKEYGLKIKKDNTSNLYIYFNPISYLDYVIYSNADTRYEDASVRCLLLKYITRLYLESEDDKEYTLEDLYNENSGILTKLVDFIIQKSGFDNIDILTNLIRLYKQKSKTLIGTYDSFLLTNLNFETYINLLDKDLFTRAQYIAMLENITGIDIKERYDFAIKNNIAVNIVDDDKDYHRWLKQQFQGSDPLKHKNTTKTHQNDDENEIHLPDEATLKNMLNNAKDALEDAIRFDKQNPDKKFDWEVDELEFQNME